MLLSILEEIKKSFREIGVEVEDRFLEVDKEEADIACNIAYKLSKERKSQPGKIAKEILEKIGKRKIKGIEKIEEKKGYLNFFLDAEELLKYLIKNSKGRKIEKTEKWVIDFSSPNPGKPMHLGHIRSTILGESLARVLEKMGKRVIRSNYMNDRGLHIGKLIAALEIFGCKDIDKISEPEKYLLDLYVRINKEIEKNPELEKLAREWIRRIDEKEEKAREWLEKIYRISMKEFKEIYDLLGVRFDEVIRETEVVEIGKEIVREALEKGIARKEESGEVIGLLESYGLPNCVILRSDGSPLYITSDFGLMKYRYERHKFDRCIYITAAEQELHFKQLFKLMEALGYEFAKKCMHIGFGYIHLKEGKMSTREGKVVLLKDILEEGIKVAEEELKKRGGKRHREIAKKIGISAIKFAVLSTNPQRDIRFDWKKFINFDGYSSAYLQYSLVRAKSVLRKAGFKIKKEISFNKLEEEEKKLIKKMAYFDYYLRKAYERLDVSELANYSYELAKTFTEFYTKLPILKAEEGVRNLRLLLTKLFEGIMEECLYLLNIDMVEEM